MAKINKKTKSIIFLDSNAIIKLYLFLEMAERRRLNPLKCTKQQLRYRRSIAKYIIVESIINKGRKVFEYLIGKRNSSDFYTSLFCDFETLHGFLESKANEKLLKLNIPFRFRKKSGLIYFYSLNGNDYVKISDLIYDLKNKLARYVEIKELEKETEYSFSEIIEIAKEIISKVFLDVPDAFIYASAIRTEADEIITTDEHFSTALNTLLTKEKWKRARASLIKALADKLPSAKMGKRITLRLPKAIHL